MEIPAAFVYLGTALVLTSVAAFHDVRKQRISNRLTGPSVIIGLFIHLFLGGLSQFGLALLAGIIAGGIFFVFYLAGGMGGGDVKLMSAVGCMVGSRYIQDVLLATVIIGAFSALVLALIRGRLRTTLFNVAALFEHHRAAGLTAHPELNLRNDMALRLPYALPIALGCLTVLTVQVCRGVKL